MARNWTPGALERLPTQHVAIEIDAQAVTSAGVILASPGANLFIAIMGLVLFGQRIFYVRDASPANVFAGATAPFPAATVLTLPIGAEPWAILPVDEALEAFNADGSSTSDFGGILTYKILDEAQGGQ